MGSVGSNRSELHHSKYKMKFFVIASLVAAAMAEADPALLYGGHHLGYAGLGYGYSGLGLGYAGHLGYGYAGLKSAPCVNAANVPVPCAAGVVGHYIGKREADAEADPALLYNGLGYSGLGYGYSGLGLGYAGLGYAGHAAVVAAPAVTYGVGVIAGQQAGLAHGITTTGIHSSHVGVCTNVHGAQVPC